MIFYGTTNPKQSNPDLIGAQEGIEESEIETIVESEIKTDSKQVEEEEQEDTTDAFASIRSKFDRFCYSGVVIDAAHTEGQKTVETTTESFIETLPEKGKKLMEEGAVILQSQSEVIHIKAKEGWATSIEAIQSFPETFKTKWNEAREIYHENKRIEAENKKFEEEQAAKAKAAEEQAKVPAPAELLGTLGQETKEQEEEQPPPVPTVTIP